MATFTKRSVYVRLFGWRVFSVTRAYQEAELADAVLGVRQRGQAETPTVKQAVLSAAQVPKEAHKEPVILANSMFLRDCLQILTESEAESLHVVTGSSVGRLTTLDRIVPLVLAHQSVAGAIADNMSLADQLIQLNEFGLLPQAYFHSHPGYGAGATMPSSTDRRTQAVMERSGARIIGGIFSRDGFVRFYANEFEPRVKVVGKRVKEVDRNVYQLQTEDL